MSIEPFGENLKFENPTTYRIRVTGHIDDRLTIQLGGMIITSPMHTRFSTRTMGRREPSKTGLSCLKNSCQ